MQVKFNLPSLEKLHPKFESLKVSVRFSDYSLNLTLTDSNLE